MVALYVHIPFCLSKCNYCDFSSFAGLESDKRVQYITALSEEIRSYKREKKLPLETVFFGGGTPSLLTPREFYSLFSAINDSFDLSYVNEFTVEVNPKTLSLEKLVTYKECGVNRLSIGLQSIHENELKKLGRIHTLDDFSNTYKLALGSGFSNINVDLMYGIPEQTKESFLKSLQYVVSLEPAHISVYGLIIEENTVFGKIKNSLDLPNEDEEADMYFQACSFLRDNAYKHYEISNFSKDGFQSLHNLRYWKAREYIGVGLSAYSYFNGSRYGNSSMLSEYLMSYEKNRACEKIDKTAELFEYAMLHLRLSSGICLSEYKARFGEDFLKPRQELIEAYEKAGYLKCDGTCVALTEKGFYVSNTILADLI